MPTIGFSCFFLHFFSDHGHSKRNFPIDTLYLISPPIVPWWNVHRACYISWNKNVPYNLNLTWVLGICFFVKAFCYSVYLTIISNVLSSLLMTLFLPIWMFFILMMSQFTPTRKMLLKFPGFFTFGRMTREGPTESNMQDLHSSLTCKVKGWNRGEETKGEPKKEMLVRVSGNNPFYGFTSLALLCAAKTILNESSKMPGK